MYSNVLKIIAIYLNKFTRGGGVFNSQSANQFEFLDICQLSLTFVGGGAFGGKLII